jgi:hypothetical protein
VWRCLSSLHIRSVECEWQVLQVLAGPGVGIHTAGVGAVCLVKRSGCDLGSWCGVPCSCVQPLSPIFIKCALRSNRSWKRGAQWLRTARWWCAVGTGARCRWNEKPLSQVCSLLTHSLTYLFTDLYLPTQSLVLPYWLSIIYAHLPTFWFCFHVLTFVFWLTYLDLHWFLLN